MRTRKKLRRGRAGLLFIYNNRCVYCTTPLDLDTVVLDHLNPLSNNGHDDINNCVPSCYKCNELKGSKVFQHLYQAQDYVNTRRKQLFMPYMSNLIPPKAEMAEVLHPALQNAKLVDSTQDRQKAAKAFLDARYRK